jgi:hypothetical protein
MIKMRMVKRRKVCLSCSMEDEGGVISKRCWSFFNSNVLDVVVVAGCCCCTL